MTRKATLSSNRSAMLRLPHLPPPVLTAYLDVSPASPRNQGARGYVTWLASTGRALGQQMSGRDKTLFRKQLRRVEDYLRTARPRARSLAVFAGPEAWEVIPLQVEVVEELHWGKPSLQQMLWLFDEHRPRGIVVIDGITARFFHVWLGVITEDKAAAMAGELPAGRKRKLVGSSHPGVFGAVGVARDLADRHLAAQRGRFGRELAQRIAQWSETRKLSPIVLAGASEAIDAILEPMSAELRARVMPVRKVLAKISPAEVNVTLGRKLRAWEREYEASLVKSLTSARKPGGAALGLDETLAALQDGRVREIVIARGLSGRVRQCADCGRADRFADPICSVCGGKRRSRTLRTLLPELVSRHAVDVEIVAGKAAEDLRAAGGIGAWLVSHGALKRGAVAASSRWSAARSGSAASTVHRSQTRTRWGTGRDGPARPRRRA